MSELQVKVVFAGDENVAVLPDGGCAFVGRSSDCEISFPDPNMSRKHLKISNLGGCLIAEDLDSTNGTYVEGAVISGQKEIQGGEVIQAGDVKIALLGEEAEDNDLDGEPFGEYVIKESIGAGGLGVVLRASHPSTGREVALKLLDTEFNDKPDVVQRFEREARAGLRIEHPSFIKFFEFGQEESIYFIAMEYFPSKDLNEVLLEKGPLSVADAVTFGVKTLEGLEWAHDAGYVHRDIKPHNLLLNDKGELKITDLGLTKRKDGDAVSMVTMDGDVLGTPEFMPPEQINSSKDANHLADIYSVGATLYTLISGRPPFDGDSVYDIVDKVLHAEHLPLGDLCENVPENVLAAIAKALKKDPLERFSNCREFINALTSS